MYLFPLESSFNSPTPFLELVHPGTDTGTEDTRRLATRSEIGEENWRVVTRLDLMRLVVIGNVTHQETVEVVHEALITGWGTLQEWINGNRAFLTWRDRLRVAREQWESSGKDHSGLLRGRLLKEAEGWLEERLGDMGQPERDFIRLSGELRDRLAQEKEDREREKQKVKRNIRRGIGIGGGIISIAFIVATFFGMQANKAIQVQKEAKEGTRLAEVLNVRKNLRKKMKNCGIILNKASPSDPAGIPRH